MGNGASAGLAAATSAASEDDLKAALTALPESDKTKIQVALEPSAAACIASTKRRLERQRKALEAKYAMFGTLLGKAGGLPEQKVAKLVTIPNLTGGGTKLQLVKPKGDELSVGAAFCGRAVILPLLGPTSLTSTLAMETRKITSIFEQCAAPIVGQKDVFITPESVLHVTLFPTAEDLKAGEEPPPDVLAAELTALKSLASAWDPFVLEAHSVVVMSSGTVLLLWLPVPESACDVETTRREFQAVQPEDFPLANGGCPDIFHTSLARICFGTNLSVDELATVTKACEEASAAVKGTKVTFDRLWYVTDSDESAMEAPPPSTASEATSLRRSWLTAANVVRNGDVISLPLD